MNKKAIALYCQWHMDDNDIIDGQKEVLMYYVQNQGNKNHKFYVDNGFLGSSLDRPALKQLLSDIEKGEISAVIVVHECRLCSGYPDRWDEAPRYLAALLNIFKNHNVEYVNLYDLSIAEKF